MIVLDNERATRVLAETAPSVFADMAFMDAVVIKASWAPDADGMADDAASAGPASGVADARDAAGAAPLVHIAIDMLKPLSCRLELEFPRVLADRINEFLYENPEDAAGSGGDDSTLELLNVIAGAFLSGYFGTGTAFKLELPFFIFGAAEVSGPAIARIEFDIQGVRAVLTLRSIRYRY